MKTELIHSYSSVSISRSPSAASFSLNGNFSASQTGLVGKDIINDVVDDGMNNNHHHHCETSINEMPSEGDRDGKNSFFFQKIQ